MRRKTVRALANLGRAASLATCAVAMGTWALWRSGWVQDRERTPPNPYTITAAEALAGLRVWTDPRDVEALCTRLLAQHAGARGLDRDAALVADARHRLADVCEWRGDTARLEAVLDEALAFDANDLVAEARRQELRSVRPDRTSAALERLRELAKMAPTPDVVAPLVRALVHRGHAQEAFDVLEGVRLRPLANDWRIACGGDPVRIANTGTPESLRLAFVAPEGTKSLHVLLPSFASVELLRLRLQADTPGQQPRNLDLSAGDARLLGLDAVPDGVAACGQQEASLTVLLDEPIDGPCVFEAVVVARPPRALALSTLLPEFAAWGLALPDDGADSPRQRFLAWRVAALDGMPVALACDGAAAERTAFACADATRAAASWQPGRACTELQIELPPGRVCHAMHTLELVVAGQSHTLDLATLPSLALQDVERTAAGFVVTGERPRLRIRHGLTGALQSVTLLGTP